MNNMGTVLIQRRSIVVPGEELAEGMDFIPGTGAYRSKNKIIANRLGSVVVDGRAIKIIPLSGKYLPKVGDVIIGKVIDITLNGWRFEINSAYSAMMTLKDATSEFISRGADLTKYYTFGDYVVAKIVQVTSQMLIDLSMKGPGLMKLREGHIITVNTNKVPRIIGKNGSMVTMIKQATGVRILVGQNGIVWISGPPEKELLVVNIIRKIEGESHTSGLTERIHKALADAGCRVVHEGKVHESRAHEGKPKHDTVKHDTVRR